MSKASKRGVDRKVAEELLFRCGGRCTICNIDVLTDWISRTKVSSFENAHIKAFSDLGPRGDSSISSDERNSVNNLMILCSKCHTNVDKTPNVYTTDKLIDMKVKKESRVKKFMDYLNNESCQIVKYKSSIGTQNFSFSDDEINGQIFSNGFFSDEEIINISENNNCEEIQDLIRSLEKGYKRRIECRIDNNDSRPICLFALGPQPLLIYLGWLFGDKQSVNVFIKQREGWLFDNDNPSRKFKISPPEKINKENQVVLCLSVSGTESIPGIEKSMGKNLDIWRIKLDFDEAGIDLISNQAELADFHRITVEVLDEIGEEYGKDKEVNLIPIVCNALAIKFGMAVMKKAHNPINIYDAVKEGSAVMHYKKRCTI